MNGLIGKLTDAERANLCAALRLAIKTQGEYERVVLKYTANSCQVAGWMEMLADLEKGK